MARFANMSAFAQTSGNYKALVCIFLYGGNDSNDILIPLGNAYSAYQNARLGYALSPSSLLPVSTVAGATYGLHPALSELHPLWAQGRLAMVANVGMLVRPTTRAQFLAKSVALPANLFSHSDQQLQWLSAGLSNASTGWCGRIADRIQSSNATGFPTGISINSNSLQLVGAVTTPATFGDSVALLGDDGSALANARKSSLEEMLQFDSGLAVYQATSRTMKDALDVARLLGNASVNAPPFSATFPDTSLGHQLAQVARIINVRSALGMNRQIFFVSQGGYDTHQSQIGKQAALLADLSKSMSAFNTALSTLGVGGDVVTFTESEFSRTLGMNTTGGTDHAWGGHCLVMGGNVRGGDLYGSFPALDLGGPDDSGSRGSWIPSTSLDQYGATLAQWFGVNAVDLPTVFPNLPNFASRTLPFL